MRVFFIKEEKKLHFWRHHLTWFPNPCPLFIFILSYQIPWSGGLRRWVGSISMWGFGLYVYNGERLGR